MGESVEDLLEQLAMMTAGLQPLIQMQQAALDIAMSPLNNLREEIKIRILESQQPVSTIYAKATYRKPSTRTSWDNRALAGYMSAHPELQEFQRVSPVKASVSIKLV